jgi:DNA-binding transcriptional MerR regulator/quercetin dioxygenase-like cupin family protein
VREYRIGEAARMVGISASALRLWERQGLVRPTRTRSGYRLYRDADIDQLRHVQLMRAQRVNAPGIRRLIRMPADARPAERRPIEPSRIRRLRLDRGMSLRAASLRSGLSVSFLSALERGTTGASVATMQRLTRAFGVTVLELFEPADGVGRHVRPPQRRVLELDGGVRIEQLATGASALESQLFVLAPGASSEGQYAHGGEEFIYVLEGDVTFWIGSNERFRLQAGDALTFPSTLPHRWRNRADGETRLLWINTPPTF